MTRNDTPAPGSGEKAQGRLRRRWPWALLLSLVGLVIGLRAALPTAVERGAAYGSRYWLGLPARIDNADFDLLEGTVVLEGVSVGADPDTVAPRDAALEPPLLDPAKALLHFDRVSAHLSWQDLREGRIRLSELALEAPAIRVLRETDGAIDPLRHAKPLAPPPVEEKLDANSTEPPAEPWPIAVDHFALNTPTIVIVDPPSGENLLQFSLESFALDNVSAKGSQFALGGVAIEGPVLRVRRDLVLAGQSAAKPSPASDASPNATQAGALPDVSVATTEGETPPAAASPSSVPAAAASGQAPPASHRPSGRAAAPAPAGYRIEKVAIERATFTWVTDHGPLDVALALHASNITADEGKVFPIDLQLEIAKGRIGLAGNVGILPPSYNGKIAWSGLPFPPLLLASLPDLASWLRSANSTGDLEIDADVAGVRGPPSLRMSGRSTIETLAIADPGDKELAVGFKRLEVVMKEVLVPLPQPGKPARTTVANLDVVKLLEPTIRYRHPSPALYALLGIPVPVPAVAASSKPDVSEAKPGAKPPAKSKAGADAATSTAAAVKAGRSPGPSGSSSHGRTGEESATSASSAPPPVDVTISSLELVAGDMQVTDTTVAPPVTAFLKQLFASASAVHFPDPEATAVKIRAILPTASELTIDGELRPGNNGDFTVSVQKLDLPVFSSYAMSAGASLDAGQASVKTRLKMRGTTMQIDNELVLRKFGISLRDPSTFERSFGMPIDLVLALLRDPSGDIKLKIPVKIDEKGTEVSTGTIIASALKAALLGALTSPLKLLGGVFDGAQGMAGGTFGVAPVKSSAGGAEPDAGASSRLDSVARLLSDRPSMGLTLRGRTGPADTPIVAEQVLVERLKDGKGLPDVEGSGIFARRRISQTLIARDKSGAAKTGEAPALSADDKALFDRYIAAAGIEPSRFDALASARAEKVRDLLLARAIAPARVTVGDREADGDPGVVISLRAK